MRNFVAEFAASYGCEISSDSYGNLYVVKGKSDTFPCIVAHLDEVHEEKGNCFEVICERGILFGFNFDGTDSFAFGQVGTGADDKNGIWLALNMIKESDTLKAVFFIEEEIGCYGSQNAEMSFFDDCRFVVECDRKGNGDFINMIQGVELCGEQFIEDCEIQQFGYNPAIGGMTDVFFLNQLGLNVSCCNLSCGYYFPHTDKEYTDIADLNNCLELLRHICSLKKTYPLM